MKIPRPGWLYHLVSLIVFPTFSVFAQGQPSVSSCIQDSTRAAIPRASVVLERSETNKRYQTQTDDKGCFTISGIEAGQYRLTILAQAFAAFERTVDVPREAMLDTVMLDVAPIRNSVLVTATRTPTPAMTLGASVDIIDRTQIEASKARTTVDLLRETGSMAVARSGAIGGITSMFVRGGESDYTKVLVDGIPVNQPGGLYDISHLSTDNISRVEIVRGPQSAVFGSDAITGVVQIFTRPGAGTPEFEYAAEGGSFATTDQRAAFRGSWKKFDFSNAFDRFDTDNVGRNNDYRNANYFGNFGYSPDSRQSLRATLLYGSVKAGTPGANAPGFTSFGPNNRMTRLERAAGLTYQGFIGSSVTQQLAYRLYDHDQYFYSAFGVSTVLHTRHRVEYHGDAALPVAGTLSYGVDYDRENAIVANVRHNRNNVGYYVQQQFAYLQKLDITGGVRIEDNTTFGTAATPRLSVSYRVLPATRIRFNAGTGIKEPTFPENFSTSTFFLGNPDLLAERSKSWETGVEQSFWRDRVTGDIGWFDNRFRNAIELVRQPSGVSQYFNIGRTRTRGLETRIRARMRQLYAQANYTFLEGHIVESTQTSFPNRPGDPLLRRPKHSGDVSLTWTDPRWSAHWSTRFVGRRADSDFFTHTPALFSNVRYSTSNAAFTYNVNRFVSAFVRLENIFDMDYQEVLGYQALGRSAVVGAKIRIGLER